MSNKYLQLTKLIHQFIALQFSPMNLRWTKKSSTFRWNCISERLYDRNKPQIQQEENYITKWGTFLIANLLEDPNTVTYSIYMYEIKLLRVGVTLVPDLLAHY